MSTQVSPSILDATDPRELTKTLSRYREPDHVRSVVEIAVSAGPFVSLWVLSLVAVASGHWWGLLLTVPAAGFLVRLFMIQHDCGHGAFFRQRFANDWVGRVLGVLTLTPYDYWRQTHAVHHATSGNLDQRGMGDIQTLTVREYLALPRWRRVGYRLYRHPAIMFGLGPIYLFVCKHRLPLGLMRAGWRPWVSTGATNLALGVLAAGIIWYVGLIPFLSVHLPITFLAAAAGVWLFYVQHQFEETTWAVPPAWTFHEAALHGSSHYDLPAVLRWFTANIGVHHVHHLSSRVPFYRLPQILRDHPQLRGIGRLTLVESFRCVRFVLWDEAGKKLVSFKDLGSGGVTSEGARA